jgi:CrcB protein
MSAWFLIFVGSGLGGITRFAVGKAVQTFWTNAFPLPTLVVNVVACLVLGFVAGKVQAKLAYHTEMQMLLMTGFCGGFSTFSTFSLETMKLLEAGKYSYVIGYTVSSMLLCLVAVWVGLKMSGK